MLEEAALALDDSTAGMALDSPSEETSCFAVALSSARQKEKMFKANFFKINLKNNCMKHTNSSLIHNGSHSLKKHTIIFIKVQKRVQKAKKTLPVGSESFSSQFDFCSSIPRTDFDLPDRDLQFKNVN